MRWVKWNRKQSTTSDRDPTAVDRTRLAHFLRGRTERLGPASSADANILRTMQTAYVFLAGGQRAPRAIHPQMSR